MSLSVSEILRSRVLDRFRTIAHHDATGGVAMMICIVVALYLQNGVYGTDYRHLLETRAGLSFGNFELIKPLLLWINDGLITIFFFHIGLELKIEFVKGHLSTLRSLMLPGVAALGGIALPALIFIAFNYDDPFAMRGWAIPTATDTAFSVALVLMLGFRVPVALKIFLLSLAIFDDIGAILIIALFYTSSLSVPALLSAAVAICALALLNYLRVGRTILYLVIGSLLWFSILKSGVHATLAGIITAFFIPMRNNAGVDMLEGIFADIKPYIALFVLPVFTLANAGIDLSQSDIMDFITPVSLGIFFGLFIGKQVGIFGMVYVFCKMGLVSLPKGVTFRQLYGVCILAGIGFSMSMFIDSLAYGGSDVFDYADSMAVILSSVCSGVMGYVYLRFFAGATYEEYEESVRDDFESVKCHDITPMSGTPAVAEMCECMRAKYEASAAEAAEAAAADASCGSDAAKVQDEISDPKGSESVDDTCGATTAAATERVESADSPETVKRPESDVRISEGKASGDAARRSDDAASDREGTRV